MEKKRKKPLSDRQITTEVYKEVVVDYLKGGIEELAERVMESLERDVDDFEAGKKSKEVTELELYKCDIMMKILGSHVKRLDAMVKKKPSQRGQNKKP